MALGNQAFKVLGMWRDNSESSQDNKFAYENFNMRIEARDGNTQLSMENERGNERIDIIGTKISNSYTDEQASISDGLLEIKGTPIGYCQIGDDIILFTTETERMSDEELQEYNEDPSYVTNKRNVFTLSSAKIQSISIGETTTLKLYLSILETSDWVNFLDDLEIKLFFSTLKSANIVKDQYEFSNYSAIGQKTAEPIANGVLYDFLINDTIDGDYIFIHSLEIRYNGDLAAIIDLRKLYNINDYKYEMLNSISIFPSYNASQDNFTTGFTQVGDYTSQGYNVGVIHGAQSQNGNEIVFTPDTNYIDTINQVFTQSFDGNGNLLGLASGGAVATVDEESITVPSNAKHTDIVVLRCSDTPDDPSLIEVLSLSCSPQTSTVRVQNTVSITVTPTPANAQCTATASYPDQHLQLVSRNNNTFTFKVLTYGEADERTVRFSCVEKPMLETFSIIQKGETRLVDTPSTYTFPADGNDEFTIKIFSSEFDASDFTAYLDGNLLVPEAEIGPSNHFIYAVEDFSDNGGDDYNIELTLYARENLSQSDRNAVLTIYLPGHIYFATIELYQGHTEPTPGGGGGGDNGDPNEGGDPGENGGGNNSGSGGSGTDPGSIDTEEPDPEENPWQV